MTCRPTVVPQKGVAPDAHGSVTLRLIGFRGLGDFRENVFNAHSDVRLHKAGKPSPRTRSAS